MVTADLIEAEQTKKNVASAMKEDSCVIATDPADADKCAKVLYKTGEDDQTRLR